MISAQTGFRVCCAQGKTATFPDHALMPPREHQGGLPPDQEHQPFQNHSGSRAGSLTNWKIVVSHFCLRRRQKEGSQTHA
jgi:hypothetical protein